MRTVSCKDQFEWGEKFSLLVLLQQNILEVISKMFTIEHKRLSLLLINKNCLHESWIYMTSNGLTNCTVRYWIVLPCNFLLSTKIFHFWWCFNIDWGHGGRHHAGGDDFCWFWLSQQNHDCEERSRRYKLPAHLIFCNRLVINWYTQRVENNGVICFDITANTT